MFPDHSSMSYEIKNKESKQVMTTYIENRDSKVEEGLRSVVLKLAETESNTTLFQIMTREGVAEWLPMRLEALSQNNSL